MTKAHDIATSLTNDQIVYLYAVENLWSSFDYFPQEELERIEESGVVIDSSNLLHLAYTEGGFDDDKVEKAINVWSQFIDEFGDYFDDASPRMMINAMLFQDARIGDFDHVEVCIGQDIGNPDYPEFDYDNDVEIQEILDAAGAEEIVKQFLAQ